MKGRSPRIRLAAAMLGRDAEMAVTRPVQFGEVSMSPAEFEALVTEMRRFVTSRGARFLVVNWDQEIDERTFLPYPPGQGRIAILQGLGLEILDTRAGAPPDWDRWTIPGDPHPDARAHARVAGLLAARLEAAPAAGADTPRGRSD